jgi:hypothetical protein
MNEFRGMRVGGGCLRRVLFREKTMCGWIYICIFEVVYSMMMKKKKKKKKKRRM